jgi:hypothetical protein
VSTALRDLDTYAPREAPPWHLPIDEGLSARWVICVLRAFLDGSGATEKGRDQRVLTLASIAAYQAHWPSFETEWQRFVGRNDDQAIHAFDLHGNRHSGHALLDDCVTFLSRLKQDEFHFFACSIDLADYERAKRESSYLQRPPLDTLPKGPHAICVDWCTGWLPDRLVFDFDSHEPASIELVFDRNEQFLRYVDRVWRAEPSRRPEWARGRQRGDWRSAKIESVRSGDVAAFVPLQAADVIAWTTARHHLRGDQEGWYKRLSASREKDFAFYDDSRLMAEYGYR